MIKNEFSRRALLKKAAALSLGVSYAGINSSLLRGQGSGGGGKATSLIYIFLRGGLSHVDTLDPKRKSDENPFPDHIDSNVDGIQLGGLLPNLAKCADKFALINSMTTQNGAHRQGVYQMLTGYNLLGTITHPPVGSFAQAILGKRGSTLPDSVVIGRGGGSAGFLEPELAPLPMGNPANGLPNSEKKGGDDLFQSRVELSRLIGKDFASRFNYKLLDARLAHYEEAVKLLESPELAAFDISNEPLRDKYGESVFGQGCLLARRLVENGVRVVEVDFTGWDNHVGIDKSLPPLAADFDRGLSALLQDLSSKGMLENTLVAVGTEFGRTPQINHAAGRDHFPAAFSCLMAGGGVQGGQRYGETDSRGKKVTKDPVKPSDFHATMGYALGIDLEKEIHAPNGRPFKFGAGGKPLIRLFGA